ncbi:MAG TPA: hypothetical protein VFR93_10960 [Candidatus Limnocylindrales bacterium]|nr:hypothetical protein [Candidatus Limnocylindrales bacterium]
MLATAAFAPATASAAPTSMDVACNNIVHGGRSPEYVWTTVDDAGVTANWATDAAHFDAANYATVTVRVCVVDADGADHGAIDQNTANDGSQLFPWSVLGYAANPCPDDSLTFGSSVDSAAVETKKSNMIACPTAGDDPSDEVDQPSDEVDQPSDEVDQPTDEVDQPSGEIDQPTDQVNDPSDDGAEPTGEVAGIQGTPGVTPPPTDTLVIASAPAGGSDGWRIVLVLVAAATIGSLVFTTPTKARRRA